MPVIPSDKKVRFVSLRVKLLIGFSLLVIISFALAFTWFYTFTVNEALSQIQEDARNTLMAAIAGVDADQFEALAVEGKPRADGYTDDPRYWDHTNWLLTVHRIEPRAFVYTYVKQGDQIVFVGSHGAPLDPPEGAPFLAPYEDISPYLKQGLFNGLQETSYANDFQPYADAWGEWVTVVTPIINSNGESVGALGVDFQAGYVQTVQQGIQRGIVIAFTVILCANLLLVMIISNSLARPIATLTRIAGRIGEGDYQQEDSLAEMSERRMSDEISTLASVFAAMVGKVHQREQSLRRQVEELRIEIDESKRKNQVTEIVDTDFFRELQSKADTMRARRLRAAGSEATD